MIYKPHEAIHNTTQHSYSQYIHYWRSRHQPLNASQCSIQIYWTLNQSFSFASIMRCCLCHPFFPHSILHHQAHYSHHALWGYTVTPQSSSPQKGCLAPKFRDNSNKPLRWKCPTKTDNTSGIISRSNSIKLQGGMTDPTIFATRSLFPCVIHRTQETGKIKPLPLTSRQGRIMHDKVIPSSTEWGGTSVLNQ